MSTISTHIPAVNGSIPATPTYAEWSAMVAKVLDLETLARILGPLVRTDAIQLPCTCTRSQPGRCDRCELSRIVAEHMPDDAWNVYEAEDSRSPRGVGMTLVGHVCARTADDAKKIAREQLGKRRPYVGRLIATLKRDEDAARREQAERDAEGW